MLGWGQERTVLSLTKACKGLSLCPLDPGLEPLSLLRRTHPLVVVHQKALLRMLPSKQLRAALVLLWAVT